MDLFDEWRVFSRVIWRNVILAGGSQWLELVCGLTSNKKKTKVCRLDAARLRYFLPFSPRVSDTFFFV